VTTRALDRQIWEQIDDGAVHQQNGAVTALLQAPRGLGPLDDALQEGSMSVKAFRGIDRSRSQRFVDLTACDDVRRWCVGRSDSTSVRYRSRRPDDAAVRVRLRGLAAQRRRFGYRRLTVLLRREGTWPNHKKLRRLYRGERQLSGIAVELRNGTGSNKKWRRSARDGAITVGGCGLVAGSCNQRDYTNPRVPI
jgi:hypothetical protein